MSIDISALGEAEEERELEKPKETMGNCTLKHLSQRKEKLCSHTNLQVAVNSSFTYNNPMSLNMQIVNHDWDAPIPGNTTQQRKRTDY